MFGIMLALLLPPPPVAVPAASAPPSTITNPDWLRRPTGEDIARYYPEKAQRDEMEGRATLSCYVTAEGALADCRALDESPADYGFGLAALKLSSTFLMRPQTKDGVPVTGGTVRIPIRFILPKAPPPSPVPTLETATRCYGIAATDLERNPTDAQARLAYFGWRMLVEVKLVPQKLRPSESDVRLEQLRAAGAKEAVALGVASERQKCAGVLQAGSADIDKLATEFGR